MAAVAALLLSIATLASAPAHHAAARATCVLLTCDDAAPQHATGPCREAARRRASVRSDLAPHAPASALLARRAAVPVRHTSMPPPARA